MIRGGFKRIGDNDGDFQYKLNNEKVHSICCTSDVSNFIRKQQNDSAGHVIRMPIERYEKQLVFNTHMRKMFFANLLHEMGPQRSTKGNAQLIRQNDFSFT